MAAASRSSTARESAAPVVRDRERVTALQTFVQQHRSEVPEAPMLSGLRDEHRHIASVLALLSDNLNAIERGEMVNPHVVYEIMDYMVTWPDRFHHPREDLIYDYAADVDHGLREDRRRLEQEHDAMARQGRELLHCIERWRGGEAEGSELLRQGREYVQRSYAHMAFEEQEVFPAIDAVLTRDEWRELAADEQLRPVRDPVFGRRVSREFRHMARKLRRSLRRGVERRAVADWVSIEALLEGYEVLSMASQSGRSVTWDTLRTGLREATYITLDQPLKAPLLCAANNTRLTLQWLSEMQEIYRDASLDLLRVNRERKDRLRLLRRAGRP
jgi:hemerythrin-like domain-containing protein